MLRSLQNIDVVTAELIVNSSVAKAISTSGGAINSDTGRKVTVRSGQVINADTHTQVVRSPHTVALHRACSQHRHEAQHTSKWGPPPASGGRHGGRGAAGLECWGSVWPWGWSTELLGECVALGLLDWTAGGVVLPVAVGLLVVGAVYGDVDYDYR
ncbi:hypothetical protein C0Q70_07956 [Pomacea canaliculata]|uniref:Uncharacterized protein n=1 Tax=Pomacea canaliculata TaxID=400727 RepID=A0A2T7PGF3_POMCA|nr:hypothetical protein C0Q70_07956 [Pomacea canaliculata]